MQKDYEKSSRIYNIKQIQLLFEESEKMNEQKLMLFSEKMEKLIAQTSFQIEEKFDKRLASIQEQLIKHYESESDNLAVKLKNILAGKIDEELNNKYTHMIENVLKQQKTENDKYIRSQFQLQTDNLKVSQIKAYIEVLLLTNRFQRIK